MKGVAVIPLKQFLDARSDSELLTKLATSVERAAVLKFLRAQPDFHSRDLDLIVDAIEAGKHV